MNYAQQLGLTEAEIDAIARSACALAEAGNLEGSRGLLEGLTFLDPGCASSWAALGTVYQKLELLPEAERVYGRAIELVPDHPVALGNLGELQLRRGLPEGHQLLIRAANAPGAQALASGRRARALVRLLART
jgi:Flp pilus assembly protein TadD